MPSKSKAQQKFMSMVHNCKKTGKCSSDKVKEVADEMKDKDAKDFASTKHKGLPDKLEKKEDKKEKKKKKNTFKEYLQQRDPELAEKLYEDIVPANQPVANQPIANQTVTPSAQFSGSARTTMSSNIEFLRTRIDNLIEAGNGRWQGPEGESAKIHVILEIAKRWGINSDELLAIVRGYKNKGNPQ